MSRKLLHYLRNERRARALSQADIAALIGAQWPSRVSRYERHQALPPFKTGLAFEYLFRKAGAELFEPIYEQVADEVKTRARRLLHDMKPPATALAQRRKESLEQIAA
jgi:transcriptional regulator with XRE-family HTH domain